MKRTRLSRPRRSKPASRLFLFVVMAAPPESSSATPVLIAFVKDDDPQAAASKALAELQKRGWRGAEIQGAKELPANPEAEDDPHVRDAITRALSSGFDVITYG